LKLNQHELFIKRKYVMNTFTTKHIPALVLAATLPLFGSVAFAAGSHTGGHIPHTGGHGHTKKADDQAKIDYSSVEEHEFGKASDPQLAKKTVIIDMTDKLRFEPAEVRVKRGETVRFVVRNKGKLMHEMVLGTGDSLNQHAKMMKKFPGMEHDEPHMAHVSPGEEHTMGWQFTKAGEYDFGCLVLGHLEGGMKGKIIVM
jgi:uncharacterized cupredoxin-like copper-binding protein